jgi:hypothetical protein
MKRICLKLYIFSLAIFIISLMMGCTGYKSFTFNNSIKNCLFEYSVLYNITNVNRAESFSIASVFLLLFSSISKKSGEDTFIQISITRTSASFPDYEALLEDHLKNEQQGLNMSEFKLDKRSQVTVDGIQGEQIVYSYVRKPDPLSIKKSESHSAIAFAVYFEKNGIIYRIIGDTLVERSAKTRNDFDHIVQTFKILN